MFLTSHLRAHAQRKYKQFSIYIILGILADVFVDPMKVALMALKQLFDHAIDSVCGSIRVQQVLEETNHSHPTQIVAIGKAASAMASGAWLYYKTAIPTLIISKYHHIDCDWFHCKKTTCIESGHPLPDENSLRAGSLLVNTVASMPEDGRLLMLVSGGASALAEHLMPDVGLDTLAKLNEQLLKSGEDIESINAQRKALSLIKNGRLLSYFKGRLVDVLAIADVPHDDINVIGSGVASTWLVKKADAHVQIIANNTLACQAAKSQATALGYPVYCDESRLYGQVEQVARTIADELIAARESGKGGIYIYGGEPTFTLPANHGVGGRAQHLALLIALYIKAHDDIEILVAGTDGSDGPTDATGAMVDSKTVLGKAQQAKKAIENANSYEFLAAQSALLKTGPTGTNVADILIALVR